VIAVTVIDRTTAALVKVAYAGVGGADIELVLTCYPGGYSPRYGFSSRRCVRAGSRTVRVATGDPVGKLQIPEDIWWVFYCDRWRESRRIEGSGACGLVFLNEAVATKTVSASSYGVTTRLELRPGTRVCRFALTEYTVPNGSAAQRFALERVRLRELLQATEFWPRKGKQ